MENKCYTVYMHVCPNNKKYIGITKQLPEKRWDNGKGYKNNKYMINAIQKYGWENIKHEILFDNLSKKEAENKEIELINKYKSNQREFGYNIANGGYVNCVSEETKKKLSIINKGKKVSQETKEKMSKNNARIWLDKKIDDKTRKKMSESHIGKKGNNKGKALKTRKKVMCIETNIIYDSITIAGNETKINSAHISDVCRDIRKSAGKINNIRLHWKYIKEE